MTAEEQKRFEDDGWELLGHIMNDPDHVFNTMNSLLEERGSEYEFMTFTATPDAKLPYNREAFYFSVWQRPLQKASSA